MLGSELWFLGNQEKQEEIKRISISGLDGETGTRLISPTSETKKLTKKREQYLKKKVHTGIQATKDRTEMLKDGKQIM